MKKTYSLAASGGLETGEDRVVTDWNTWVLEGALGNRVILWEVVPLDNVTDVSDDVVRVEVKTTKAGNNGVSDASQGNGAGRSAGNSCSTGWCGESTSDADSSCKDGDDGVHGEDSELD